MAARFRATIINALVVCASPFSTCCTLASEAAAAFLLSRTCSFSSRTSTWRAYTATGQTVSGHNLPTCAQVLNDFAWLKTSWTCFKCCWSACTDYTLVHLLLSETMAPPTRLQRACDAQHAQHKRNSQAYKPSGMSDLTEH